MTSQINSLLRMKNPDQIFDLICAYNYFWGTSHNKVPVEENRLVFKRIKKLIAKTSIGGE